MNILKKFSDYKKEKNILHYLEKFEEHLSNRRSSDTIDEIEKFLFFVDSLSPRLLSKFKEKIFPSLLTLHRGGLFFADCTENSLYYKMIDNDTEGYSLLYKAQQNYSFHLESILFKYFEMEPSLLISNMERMGRKIENYHLYINFAVNHCSKYTADEIISFIFSKMEAETVNEKYSNSHYYYLSKLDNKFFDKEKNRNLFFKQIQIAQQHCFIFDFSKYTTPDYYLNPIFIQAIINEIESERLDIIKERTNLNININILNLFRDFLLKVSVSENNEDYKNSFTYFEPLISRENLEEFKNNYHYFETKSVLNFKNLCYFLGHISQNKCDIICEAIVNDRFLNSSKEINIEDLDSRSLEILLNFTKNHNKLNEKTSKFLEHLYVSYEPSKLTNITLFDTSHILQNMLNSKNFIHEKSEEHSYEKFKIMISKLSPQNEEHKELMESYFLYFINNKKTNEAMKFIEDYQVHYPLYQLCKKCYALDYKIRDVPEEIASKIWQLFNDADFQNFNENSLNSVFKESKFLYLSIKEKRHILGNLTDSISENKEYNISKKKRL